MTKNNKTSIIERLANSINLTFNNKIVFSDPVEKEGVIVIPVAKVSYGFGGGSGKDDNKKGTGGGIGVFAQPIGYIEIKNGKTQYIPIHHPFADPSIIFVSGVAAYYVLKGLSKLLRSK